MNLSREHAELVNEVRTHSNIDPVHVVKVALDQEIFFELIEAFDQTTELPFSEDGDRLAADCARSHNRLAGTEDRPVTCQLMARVLKRDACPVLKAKLSKRPQRGDIEIRRVRDTEGACLVRSDQALDTNPTAAIHDVGRDTIGQKNITLGLTELVRFRRGKDAR